MDIVITIHREDNLINEALFSLANQSILPSRVIIIFNGHPRDLDFIIIPPPIICLTFIYFYFDKCNANYARNCGLKHCISSLIAFLDFDDLWLDKRIQSVMESRNISEWEIFYSDFLSGRAAAVIKKIIVTTDADLKVRNSVGGFSSIVFTRNALNLIGLFDEDLESCQDWDVWIRAKTKKLDFYHEKSPLTFHRVGSLNTISQDPKAQYRGLRKLYFKHHFFLSNTILVELLVRRLLCGSINNQIRNVRKIGMMRFLRHLIKKFFQILISLNR